MAYCEHFYVRHECADSPIIFMSDAVMSKNHCGIAFWVTKKTLFMVIYISFGYLQYIMPWEHTKPAENNQLLILLLSFKDNLS